MGGEDNMDISKSDKSCISNPEIGQPQIGPSNLRFLISGFEMQDLSDFEIPPLAHYTKRYAYQNHNQTETTITEGQAEDKGF